MFISLAELYYNGNNQNVFLLHPEQIANWLEGVWINAARTPATDLSTGNRPLPREILGYDYGDLQSLPALDPAFNSVTTGYTASDLANTPPRGNPLQSPPVSWDHLIYAYMLENTRMVQIFQRVLYLYAHGEDLSTPSPETQAWLRNTEMLFFRHLPGYFTYNLRSEIRPDLAANRRNAYYRMFGMDLGHGTVANKPYPFHKPKHSNREFVRVIEQTLREFYRAVINLNNSSGANSTDYASIANLCTQLNNMLQVRRQGGNLSREEFNAVAMMSWFDLTLRQDNNLPLLADLHATASSPEDRLIKIGERVGIPANPKSGSFIQLGPLLSQWLLMVEEGAFNDALQVENALRLDVDFRRRLTDIITQWSIATGKPLKAMITKNTGVPQLA